MNKLLATFLCMISCLSSYSQNVTLSGYVFDNSSKEVLIGALISVENTSRGAVSNHYGYYALSLPPGTYHVTCSYLGYVTKKEVIEVTSDFKLNFELNDAMEKLREVIVNIDASEQSISSNLASTQSIGIDEIRNLPNVFGEFDVVKALQWQNGVKTIGDGSSALFVRGGSSDQNLILIDEAPVYNPSHLFGLVSVFNPDALNNVTFIKSNMPAQYGGRVSAVVDAKMKEGNLKRQETTIGLSPFALSVSTNGPVVKEKSAFFTSLRKSIIDLVAEPGKALEIVPAFYDFNLKANTEIGEKKRIYFSFYSGHDRISSSNGFSNQWGNITSSVRLTSIVTPKIFSTSSLIFSQYKNEISFKEQGRDYFWKTGLQDFNFKQNFSYYIKPDNELSFGIDIINHFFTPGESPDPSTSISNIQAFESALYLAHDVRLSNDLIGINYGLRISSFANYGAFNGFMYNDHYILESTFSNEKGVYRFILLTEPRLNLNFKVGHNNLKLAYTRNAQYMQVLQNSSLSYSALETWFPVGNNVLPLIADVYSLGWFSKNFQGLSYSLEAYWKHISNQIDYVDHARLTDNPQIEGELRRGDAVAYGIESNLKYIHSGFSAQLAYSYARVFWQIDQINGGETYRSPFDIPHDLRANITYSLTDKWKLNSAFIYMSGRPATLPVGFYFDEREPVPIYTGRNESRFPPYHRLDAAVIYTFQHPKKRQLWEISLGVFNAYARKNPLGYEFVRRIGSSNQLDVYQYYLFTIMPNFSIKLKL